MTTMRKVIMAESYVRMAQTRNGGFHLARRFRLTLECGHVVDRAEKNLRARCPGCERGPPPYRSRR